jgi:signal transduction histidine kinase
LSDPESLSDRPAAALAQPAGGVMGQRIRETDWSGTPLGPITGWPQSLRTAVGICTESRFPMAIWWGPEAIQLYNDGYVTVLGAKHPRSLGQSGMECWAEIWDVVGPLYTQVMRHGQSTWSDDLLLLMDRYGYVEETYFTFSYSLIRDESGGAGGLLITCAETTDRVVGERRLRTLRDLAGRSGDARTAAGACELAAAILADNPDDVPLAAFYLLEPGGATAVRAAIAGDASAFPPTVPTAGPEAETAPLPLGRVLESGGPIVQREPREGNAPVETIVLLVDGPSRSAPIGFLVAAASPRRRLDDAYRAYFELVAGHVATAVGNARAREAEHAVRESEERYRAFIELTSEAVWRVELEEPVPASLPAETQIDRFYRHAYLAECNDAMAHMYGYGTAADLVGARLVDLLPSAVAANLEYLRAFVETGYRLTDAETHEIGRDGRPRYFVNNLYGIVRDGVLVRVWGSQRDVTERRQTLERLQHAQRMEAVGKLAGGIAHEVNNMMSVVLGCSDFLLRRPDLAPAARADVEQVREAAERSAAITAQLLAFSRRQRLQPVPLDLNAVVRDLQPVLRRSLGDMVALELRLSQLQPIVADRGQLQQVLLNLALNARDAMPEGGRVIVETSAVELGDGDAAEHPEIRLRRGPHALLAMTDTGHGMDAATASRVFEPFFTTKGVGKGTGLGLSTVYGIVKQSDGYVWVDSEPGRGTTFRIYLPATDAPLPPEVAPAARPEPAGGGTILVVDDETLVRTTAVRALEEDGYEVLAADSGAAALELLEREGARVRLVVTDVSMAGIDGHELGHRLLEARPELPVLFMSGYPADEVIRRGLLQEHHAFIQKPFAPSALAGAVRALIDASASRAAQE